MNIIIGDAPTWVENALENAGFEVLKLGICESLPKPVSGHADLVTAKFDNRLIVAGEKERILKELDSKSLFLSKYELCTCDIELSDTYPGDVPLNFAVVGNFVICNPKTVWNEIVYIAPKSGKTVIPVLQGYTKCSTLVVDDKSIITDDESIFRATQGTLDTLLVSKGSISLPGYNYGFIGGASFTCGGTVYFFGNLSSHPDHLKIRSFIEERGMRTFSLSSEHNLIDIGGAIVL